MNIIKDKYEYKMSAEMAHTIINQETKGKKKGSYDEQKILCKVVNDCFGIKGTCRRVIVG